MINKVHIVVVGVIIWVISCNSNHEEEMTSKEAESQIVKQLLKEGHLYHFDSLPNLDMVPIINKYFYAPHEIVNSITADENIVYHSMFTFYSGYLSENGSSIKFYWDDEILKNNKRAWIYDKNQCEQTLLITYENEQGQIRDFCACFRNKKIYSVLPFGDGTLKVTWARRLKSIEVEEGILMVPSD